MHETRTPPGKHDWGERTQQACRNRENPPDWRTDAAEMGRRYGISDVDVEAFRRKNEKAICYPDFIIHERTPTLTPTEKASNAIIKGNKKGCGKSTLLRYIARQMMSHNDERFIWRGSTSRSEWLPFRKWTTLYLPASVEPVANWMREGDTPGEAPMESVDDLEDVVRDVVTYSDLGDLYDQLGSGPAGTFNVVYPDPAFEGCSAVLEASQRYDGPAPYVPAWAAAPADDVPETPITHWWYAFIVGRVDNGPYQPWALGFDESGDIMPKRTEIRQDQHRTFDKVMATRSALADSRRAFFTWLMVCHYEGQVFDEILKEADWRILLPDGSPNPVKHRTATHPLGFDGVKMNNDIMSWRSVGTALVYDQGRFSLIKWDDIPDEPGDEDRWLKIELSADGQDTRARVRSRTRRGVGGNSTPEEGSR